MQNNIQKNKIITFIKKDLENKYKANAEFWETEHVITYLDFNTKKMGVTTKLYMSEQAYIDCGTPIKERKNILDIPDELNASIIDFIKTGLETKEDVIQDKDLNETIVKGFFNTKK
jgi:hypothetical protein